MLRTRHDTRSHRRPQAAACGAVLCTPGQVRVSTPVSLWRQRKA